MIEHISLPVPWSHFHFLLHVRSLDWADRGAKGTSDVSDKGVIPELKADVLSVCSIQVVLISPLSTLLRPVLRAEI